MVFSSRLNALARTLDTALKELKEQTGWVGVFAVGGPDVRLDDGGLTTLL